MKTQRTPALAALVAAFAIAAPTAVASGVSPDDRPGARGIGPAAASVSPDDRPGARGAGPASVPAGSASPDDRPGTHGIGPSPVSLSPDDRFGPRGDTVAQARPPATIVVRPGGFDWADAGIGAAAMIGAGLLATGLILVGRRRSLAHPA